MRIWDYLEKPDTSPATADELEAIRAIIAQAGDWNTAMLYLYRAARQSNQDEEELLDEIERRGKFHDEEIQTLKGEPVEIPAVTMFLANER